MGLFNPEIRVSIGSSAKCENAPNIFIYFSAFANQSGQLRKGEICHSAKRIHKGDNDRGRQSVSGDAYEQQLPDNQETQ